MGKVLALQTWAGLVEVPVAVIGATRTRLRVRVLSGQVRLPNRRLAHAGDAVLVPAYAVRDVPEPPKLERRTGMYEPYDKDSASVTDRVAWALCQIIDDDAPLRWTRYRFAAECIAGNPALMADLKVLAEQLARPAGTARAAGEAPPIPSRPTGN